MNYQTLKLFKRMTSLYPETVICFEDTKNTGLVIFTSLKQKKLILNFFLTVTEKKITDSRKRAKILADNRKSHRHPIETLKKQKI